MKRFFCLFMSFTMFLTLGLAEELTEEYSQPEKMYRQIELGSGLRGAMKVAVTGDTQWAALLSPLNDAEFQMRMICSGKEMDAQLYAVKNELEDAHTEIYKNEDHYYLRSSLLMDSVLSLPFSGDLISSITSTMTQGNPSYLSFILKLLFAGDDMFKSASSGISTQLRAWIESFTGEPEVTSGQQGTRMLFSYDIEPEELKKELKVLVNYVSHDAELVKMLNETMTEEQANLIMNTQWSWYIDQLIDSLPLSEGIRLSRLVSMQGEEIEASMYLPLADPENRWKSLEIRTNETCYILKGDYETLEWRPEDQNEDHLKGTLLMQGTTQPFCVAYELTKDTEKTSDAEDYHHETITYTFRIAPDWDMLPPEADHDEYLKFDPIEAQLRLHYYSKSAKRAATTLDVTLAGLIPGGRIQAAAKFRTSTPWELTHMDIKQTIPLEKTPMDERIQIAEDLLANLLVRLDTMKPADDAEEQTELATASDMAPAETEDVDPMQTAEEIPYQASEEETAQPKEDNQEKQQPGTDSSAQEETAEDPTVPAQEQPSEPSGDKDPADLPASAENTVSEPDTHSEEEPSEEAQENVTESSEAEQEKEQSSEETQEDGMDSSEEAHEEEQSPEETQDDGKDGSEKAAPQVIRVTVVKDREDAP